MEKFYGVKEINCNKTFLPKLGLGESTRINRKAIKNKTKHGEKIKVPFIATFKGSSMIYESEFKIVKMFDVDGVDYVFITEENLGQFGIRYDAFVNNQFKGEFNSAWELMLKNQEHLRENLNEANTNLFEQQQLHKMYKDKYKTEEKEHRETKGALVVAEQTITTLQEKINGYEKDKNNYNKNYTTQFSDIPQIVDMVIRMYERGTSRDTIINKIVKKLKK